MGEVIGLAMDAPTLMVAGVVGIAVLGVAWFAVKFWLASTRPADIREIHSPTLDRMNREALEQMMGEEEQEEDEAPEELKKIVPGENGGE